MRMLTTFLLIVGSTSQFVPYADILDVFFCLNRHNMYAIDDLKILLDNNVSFTCMSSSISIR